MIVGGAVEETAINLRVLSLNSKCWLSFFFFPPLLCRTTILDFHASVWWKIVGMGEVTVQIWRLLHLNIWGQVPPQKRYIFHHEIMLLDLLCLCLEIKLKYPCLLRIFRYDNWFFFSHNGCFCYSIFIKFLST